MIDERNMVSLLARGWENRDARRHQEEACHGKIAAPCLQEDDLTSSCTLLPIGVVSSRTFLKDAKSRCSLFQPLAAARTGQPIPARDNARVFAASRVKLGRVVG
jgi:hypothetical protein